MIRPVSGIHAEHVTQKPHASTPCGKLEFLQNKDVFFSEQSYRAQLAHFLSNKPDKPLMFSYVHNDLNTLWDYLVPVTQRDVILLTPLEQVSLAGKSSGKATKRYGQRSQVSVESTSRHTVANQVQEAPESMENMPMPFENVAFDTTLANLIRKGNPFAQMKEGSKILASGAEEDNVARVKKAIAAQAKNQDEPTEDLMIQMEVLSGERVKPERFFQLEQAFSKVGLNRERPAWVLETPEAIEALKEVTPQQAGYQRVEHPWRGLLYRTLAKIAAPLLGLTIKDNALALPNGAVISLTPISWQNAAGKTVTLYKALGLPDGTWIRLNQVQAEEAVPYKNQRQLRMMVEAKMHQLEATGKV